jgi:Na+/H+ antiporter NhaC
MFDILDRQTTLTGNQKKIIAAQIPTAFLYLGCWFLMAGVVYYFFGLETRGKANEQIDRELGVAHA